MRETLAAGSRISASLFLQPDRTLRNLFRSYRVKGRDVTPDERWWVLRAQAGDATYVNRHTLRVLRAVELLRGELNAQG